LRGACWPARCEQRCVQLAQRRRPTACWATTGVCGTAAVIMILPNHYALCGYAAGEGHVGGDFAGRGCSGAFGDPLLGPRYGGRLFARSPARTQTGGDAWRLR
jgi:hypothetical protein